MKFSCRSHGVLTNHGIGDEEHLAGLQFFLQHAQLVHQIIVNVQAAGSVHQDYIAGRKFCFLNGALDDFERLVRSGPGPDRCSNRLRHLRELLARGGAIDVSRDDQRPMAVLRKPFCKFPRGGGLTGTLQTDNHPHRRWARSEERLGVLAKHGRKFVANDLDDLLVGRKLQHDLAADCFRADIGQKFIGHADVNVTFQQRLANFRKRRVQVLVREFTLSPQVLERALQLICQILKHVLK